MVFMRIEIRRHGDEIPVVIVTFHTQKERFDSDYDKSKFFRELHGWKQTVPRNGKRYVYERKGLLGEVPHVKVSESTFIVKTEEAKPVMDYFQEWADKVQVEMFEMMMRQQEFMRRMCQDEVREEL